MGYTVWKFVSQLHKEGTFFNRYGKWFAFALPLAGLFDVLENLVSFFMIANPVNFPDWLVIPYSTLAVIKFGFWGIAILWLVISVITLVGGFLQRKLVRPVNSSL